MTETTGFPVDFTTFTPDQHAKASQLCLDYAMQVMSEARTFIKRGRPLTDDICVQLKNATPELAISLGTLVDLVTVFFGRLETEDQTFSARLLAEASKGETKQ